MKLSRILKKFVSFDRVNKKHRYMVVRDKTDKFTLGYYIKDKIIKIINEYKNKDKAINQFKIEVKKKNFSEFPLYKIKVKINKNIVIIADPFFFTRNELIKAAKIYFTEEEINNYLNWIGKKDIKQLTKSELIDLIE